MNRIVKYQESILKFLKTKSCFQKIIKSNKVYENIIENSNEHLLSIILLTIFSNQTKNKDLKSHHGYYMTSGIDILLIIVNILDNELYYYSKYGKDNIISFITEMPIYIFKCISQNIETLEDIVEKDVILKLYHNCVIYLQTKISLILMKETLLTEQCELVKKTDIIKFNFKDKTLLKNKYKHLKQINKEKLLKYIENKYGSVCNCAFTLGWLLSVSDMNSKKIEKLEKLANYFAIIIKLSEDFINLERDIKYSDVYSNNFIVNYGIHACFALFIENKVLLLEGCMSLDILTVTFNEIFDYIELKFDKCIANTEIELISLYSSFTGSSNINTNKTE
jgi:hypothetical protein